MSNQYLPAIAAVYLPSAFGVLPAESRDELPYNNKTRPDIAVMIADDCTCREGEKRFISESYLYKGRHFDHRTKSEKGGV